LIFLAMRVLPGDPLALVTDASTGTQTRLSDEDVFKLRASLGLNDPYYVQYGRWMYDVLRGDFGSSFWRGEPIRELLIRRGQISLQIAVMAVAFAWLIGVPLGSSALRSATPGSTSSRAGSPRSSRRAQLLDRPDHRARRRPRLHLAPPLSITYFQDDPMRNLQMTLGRRSR
jgi:peptide/nickel transport system permease protein